MANGELVFGGIHDGRKMLVSYTEKPGLEGVMGTIASAMSSSLNTNIKRRFSPHADTQNYAVAVEVYDRFIYVAACDDGFPSRLTFAFLQTMREEWMGSRSPDAVRPVIKSRMRFYSHDPSADSLRQVQDQVDQVRKIMEQNIEKTLLRGESLEETMQKSEHMQQQSYAFQQSTTKLKWKMIMENWKMTLLLIAVILTIVIVVGTAIGLTIYFLVD